MDAIGIKPDNTFDSGPQPVTVSGAWQQICRLPVNGADALLKIKVLGNTIGNIKLTQGAIADDADPVDVCSSATSPNGFTLPALSNIAYVVPAPTFPLAAGSVFQVRVQGRAREIAVWANTAGGGGATVQVSGSIFNRQPQ